jgi:cytochrome c-type biogenesis protein CcmH/NrfF
MNITAILLVAAIQGSPQSTGPEHAAYDPTAAYTHNHEGDFGEELRVLEQSLRCSCGCTLDLHTCQLNMQCGVSPRWSARILQLLEGGETDEAILDEFVAEYGKAVLIAPPLEGFNWVGYLTPAMALVMGGALVGLVLRRSIRSRQPQPVEAVSEGEWERLQSEIRKIEEEEAASDW